jgi:adenylosuccinate lyase
MKAWEDGVDFKDLLKRNAHVTKYLQEMDIMRLFDLRYHLKHVDELFKRVFRSAR